MIIRCFVTPWVCITPISYSTHIISEYPRGNTTRNKIPIKATCVGYLSPRRAMVEEAASRKSTSCVIHNYKRMSAVPAGLFWAFLERVNTRRTPRSRDTPRNLLNVIWNIYKTIETNAWKWLMKLANWIVLSNNVVSGFTESILQENNSKLIFRSQ